MPKFAAIPHIYTSGPYRRKETELYDTVAEAREAASSRTCQYNPYYVVEILEKHVLNEYTTIQKV